MRTTHAPRLELTEGHVLVEKIRRVVGTLPTYDSKENVGLSLTSTFDPSTSQDGPWYGDLPLNLDSVGLGLGAEPR